MYICGFPDTFNLQVEVNIQNLVDVHVVFSVQIASYPSPGEYHVVWILLIIPSNCFATPFAHSYVCPCC